MLDSKWTTAFLVLVIIFVLMSFAYEDIMTGIEYLRGYLTSNVPVANSANAERTEPWAGLELEHVTRGFDSPVYITGAGDGSGRLFVVEKDGKIKIIRNGAVVNESFLDISGIVNSNGGEMGLLSVAFHPGFSDNGRFFVDYTDAEGDTIVAEYSVSDSSGRADPDSGKVLLEIPQPASNHNGGQIDFGPNGYLYIGMGDGGRAGDPWGNAQNKNALLGKILRINVDGSGSYDIPDTNPFAGYPDAKPEVWSYGLRNPWRFSFDSETGDLYIADVGQNKWEEVHFQPASSKGGENYGWNYLEGSHEFKVPDGYDTGSLKLPVAEYSHDDGCSVTGGYVYRGDSYPVLKGTYFFSDFCSGKIWGLRKKSDGSWEMAEFIDSDLGVSSFGQGDDREIYVLNFHDGAVYRLTSAE